MTDPVSSRPPLTPDALGSDPVEAFRRWLAEAREHAGMKYANAMTLSTLSPDGMPQGRIVLLKGVDSKGFRFFTNYGSEKGAALEAHPRASLSFYWDGLGRQVLIRGGVERLGAEESDEYFRTRPRGSQIGAWASEQSRVLESREVLERRYREIEERFEGREVPRPDHWGGFLLSPVRIEFWQDGAYRLHDRLLYTREDEGWRIERLSP